MNHADLDHRISELEVRIARLELGFIKKMESHETAMRNFVGALAVLRREIAAAKGEISTDH